MDEAGSNGAREHAVGGYRLSRRSVVVSALLSPMPLASGFGQNRPSIGERTILVASTTTTNDSGFLNYIAPLFLADTGILVRFVSFGTGQALDTGRRGDVDVVFTHFRSEEERFLAEGHGVRRHPVMYNDFVLIGPKADPAGVRGLGNVAVAFRRIKESGKTFISRGDRSGTHQTELTLWRQAGIDVATYRGASYREIGQGMGAALNMAAAQNAYLLSDRGTWLSFRNRGDLAILVEGSQAIRNQYGVIRVNPDRHPHVKSAYGQVFIDWLIGARGQAAIEAFRIDGEQPFFPNAAEPGA